MLPHLCSLGGLELLQVLKTQACSSVSGQWCFSILPVLPVVGRGRVTQLPTSEDLALAQTPGKSVKGILSLWGGYVEKSAPSLTLQSDVCVSP